MSTPRTRAEADAYLAERGVDVDSWPLPTEEQIERLRALWGFAASPAAATAAATPARTPRRATR